MIYFIGPTADTGGPAIKNKILCDYLRGKHIRFKQCNTYSQSWKNRITCLLKILFTNADTFLVAVGRKGNRMIYPLLYWKKKIRPSVRYALVCIGGQVAEELAKRGSLFRRSVAAADLCTVETETLLKKVQKQGFTNFRVLPNYVEGFSMEEEKEKDFGSALRFVYLSSIRNCKGLQTMISAFQLFVKKVPDALLDIYGPIQPDFNLKIFSGLQQYGITYRGVVKKDQVLSCLSGYHVFIFPTECSSEGFPAVLVEAQYAGLPVIASDICYNAEIIQHQKNGYIYPAGNVERLEQALMHCQTHREELAVISEENKRNSRQYDADRVLSDFLSALQKKGWRV